MKKILLASLCLMSCLFASAQSTKDTALELVEGTNSQTFETADGNQVYYKYTAPEGDGKLIVLTISNYNPSISAEDADGNRLVTCTYEKNSKTVVPAKGGETVYVKASCYSTEYSFEAAFVDADLVSGASCDDPVVATEGEYTFVQHLTDADGASVSTYVAYDAAEDGVVELQSSGWISSLMLHESCDDAGTSVSTNYVYDTGGYAGKFQAEAGKRYILEVSCYSPFMLKFTMTHPTEGSSCDLPFEASTSAPNVVPAAAGTYWYELIPEASGYVYMASESSLPSGTVSAYSSCSAYSADASVSGSYMLRAAVSSSSALYICVEKAEATDADEQFTLTIKDAEAGDSFSNPKELVIGENETPEYNGEYYWTYTVPEGDSKMLKIDASNAGIVNSSTQVSLYSSTYEYSSLAYGSTSLSYEVTGGSTYVLKWRLAEGVNGFKFTASLSDIEAGETAGNPIEAVIGTNDLGAGTAKYYKYTMTKSAWLSIDVDPTVTVTFPEDPSSKWSGNYTQQVNGTKHRIQATEGTTYYIVFESIAEDMTFELAEEDYAKGESQDNPIEITEENTALPEEVCDYWYVYTCPRGGKLTVKSDIEYVYDSSTYQNSSVEVTLNDGYAQSLSQYTDDGVVYEGSFEVAEGDKAYIHVVLPTAQTGCTLTCSVGDFEQGESSSNPLPLEEGAMVVGKASHNSPIWYSVELCQNDTLYITGDDYFGCALYEESDLDNPVQTLQYEIDYDTYEYSYYLNYTRTDEGKANYLFCIDYTYGDVNLVVTIKRALVDGISSLNDGMNSAQQLNVYDLQGRKVFSGAANKATELKSGLYIVNGKKVVIK